MSKKSKLYKKTHYLLILLIFLTVGIAIYILNTPQKTGSSVARTSFNTCSNSNSNSLNCSIASTTNNNTLVAVIGTRGVTANRVTSINQTGAVWVKATQAVNENGNTTEIWYTTSLSSASTNITINLAEQLNASAIITQYSGILTTNALDKTANSTGSSNTANTGTTTQTSQSNQLWVGGLTVNDIGAFGNPNNDFTKIAESASTGGLNNTRNNTTYLEKIVTSTGIANTSASISSNNWSGAIATFNTAGAPTQIVFVDSPFNLTAGVCSSALTLETQDSSGAAVNASSDVLIQLSTNNPDSKATFYYTPDCSGSSFTTFTFDGNEKSKTFYMKDLYASGGLSITATKISGSDSLTDDSLNYTISPASISKFGLIMPGQTLPFKEGKASGSPTAQTAGVSFSITETRALDAFDNTVTGYSGIKSLTYSGSANSPNNTPPTYTTNVNFVAGVSATVLTTTLYYANDNTVLSVTENGNYNSSSTKFAVKAAVLANYNLIISNTKVVAGSCSENTLDVTAKDSYGNPRTADASTVLLTSNSGGLVYYSDSSCSNSQSSFMLANGAVRIYWKATKKALGVSITATKNGDTPSGTVGQIDVSPGAASMLIVKLPGQNFADGFGLNGAVNFPGLRSPNATAGNSFGATLYAVDTYFNLVDSGTNNYSGNKFISWSNSVAENSPRGDVPVFPVSNINFVNGVSTTLLNATYFYSAGNRTIRADDINTPVQGIASSSFTVQPESAHYYDTTTGNVQKAGVPFNITIAAKDVYANALGSLYAAPFGTYTWTSTATNSPDGTPPILGNLLSTDFINGTATKNVILFNAQAVSFTVGEPNSSTVTGSVSTTVEPGDVSADANDSTVMGNPTGFDSRAETITIIIKDTWRNPISNLNKSYITVSGTGSASVEQPILNTNANGVTTAKITWISIGDYSVRVSISGVKLVQNDGFATDLDGFLDSTHSITIYENHPSTRLQGGTKIQGGTRIQ